MELPIDIIIRVDAKKENDSGEYTFQCKALGELVRCKDCNWFKSGIDINGKPFTKCIGANGSVRTYGHTEPDWFCADGERKEKGDA